MEEAFIIIMMMNELECLRRSLSDFLYPLSAEKERGDRIL